MVGVNVAPVVVGVGDWAFLVDLPHTNKFPQNQPIPHRQLTTLKETQ